MYDPENNSRETIVLNNFKSKKPPNNIMYGLAIKLWSSEFDKESDEFKTLDSVVYLSHDISNSDILYLSSVISHLVGDDSLEDVFRKHVPVVKGEPISWDEPLVKMEQPEYESGNEETKGYEWFDDGCSQDEIEIKPKIAKKFIALFLIFSIRSIGTKFIVGRGYVVIIVGFKIINSFRDI